MDEKTLDFTIKDPLELNLAYIPFVTNGGLFVPTKELFSLGDMVKVHLVIESKNESLEFTGKVVWVTPINALHHVLPGVGVQIGGENAKSIVATIENHLSKTMDVGGYTCGITESTNNPKTI